MWCMFHLKITNMVYTKFCCGVGVGSVAHVLFLRFSLFAPFFLLFFILHSFFQIFPCSFFPKQSLISVIIQYSIKSSSMDYVMIFLWLIYSKWSVIYIRVCIGILDFSGFSWAKWTVLLRFMILKGPISFLVWSHYACNDFLPWGVVRSSASSKCCYWREIIALISIGTQTVFSVLHWLNLKVDLQGSTSVPGKLWIKSVTCLQDVTWCFSLSTINLGKWNFQEF